MLGKTTGLSEITLGAMVGRQLPFFSVLVPFWVIWAFVGFRPMLQIWPAILVTGVSFAITQFLVSNYHGPWLVDVVASLVSLAFLYGFLQVWQPKEIWESAALHAGHGDTSTAPAVAPSRAGADVTERSHTLVQAWTPWIILCLVVFIWGTTTFKGFADTLFLPQYHVAGLDNLVRKMPPAVPKPSLEAAVFKFNILTMTGTGILVAALIAGIVIGYTPWQLVKAYVRTIGVTTKSLITISAMLGLGTLTRYSGLDATLGLALRRQGSSIRSSRRCSAGSASRSQGRTRRRMCSSAACRP